LRTVAQNSWIRFDGYLKKGKRVSSYGEAGREVELEAVFSITELGGSVLKEWFTGV
jgi:hypothetical protein